MNLKYYNTETASHLVDEFYSIKYSEKVTPLKTTIIPMAFSSIAFFYSGNQYIIQNKNKKDLNGLTIFGQFIKSFPLYIDNLGLSCGISFKPTTLFKLTNIDLSQLTNDHVPLESIEQKLSNKLKTLFLNHANNYEKLFKEISIFLNSLPILENKDTRIIDSVIHEITKREGLLSVNEILKTVPFGQKTLETKFKKIVGITPGKYIQIKRFTNLMRKYEKEQIKLKDLIYMYDYYDESHFAKDFKLFTSKSYKNYFQEDYILVKKALKNSCYDFLQ
jgi:AraC-like DNA-binding protein